MFRVQVDFFPNRCMSLGSPSWFPIDRELHDTHVFLSQNPYEAFKRKLKGNFLIRQSERESERERKKEGRKEGKKEMKKGRKKEVGALPVCLMRCSP